MSASAFPLVSIVVPCYNQAEFLAQAIESVLAQAYPNVELLCFDDGSTDDTSAVLQRYRGRFYFERQANIGQAATLNKGWRRSRGEILGYLSADDILHPEAVDEAVRALQQEPGVVATYGDVLLIDERSRSVGRIERPEFDFREMVAELVCAPNVGAFFRRAAFVKVGGWNERYRRMPDYEFWLRLALLGPLRRIPKVLASYRMHSSSQSFSRVCIERADEPQRIIEQFFAANALPEDVAALRRRALANALLVSARMHLGSGRPLHSIGRIARAIATSPETVFRMTTLRKALQGLAARAARLSVRRRGV